ncbi:MAG: hypothetical protein H6Q10_2557 [Acidobacteria bacterium]|nr:hypothetical protein [Acidobacteriota bacterium]
MLAPGFRTMKSVGFLFKAPFILALLFVINLMTSPGHWWVQWAALGIGIAWILALFRVMRAVILAGGLAALGIYLFNRASKGGAPSPGAGTRPPDIPSVALDRE